MRRLTKEDILKFPMTVYGRAIGKQLSAQVISELLKYKQLEEDLGCPLEVYVKATIDGIKVDGSIFKVKVRKDKYGYYFALSNGSCFPFYLKDYKKTWRLEEDQSE